MFKVGDKVYLKKSSSWFGYSILHPSSESVIGVIVNDSFLNIHDYKVEWGDYSHTYSRDDLALAEPTTMQTPETLQGEKHACTCDSKALFNFGCKCGGI